jgi:hypothetical protein
MKAELETVHSACAVLFPSPKCVWLGGTREGREQGAEIARVAWEKNDKNEQEQRGKKKEGKCRNKWLQCRCCQIRRRSPQSNRGASVTAFGEKERGRGVEDSEKKKKKREQPP